MKVNIDDRACSLSMEMNHIIQRLVEDVSQYMILKAK